MLFTSAAQAIPLLAVTAMALPIDIPADLTAELSNISEKLPEASILPALPETPDLTKLKDTIKTAVVPDELPDLSSLKEKLPEMPDVSKLKDIAAPDVLPDLSDVKEKISDLNDGIDLTKLPKLPDLPDFTNITDLPDMSKLEKLPLPDLSTLTDKLPDTADLSNLKDKIPDLDLSDLKDKIPGLELSDLKDKIPDLDLSNLKDVLPGLDLSDLKDKIPDLDLSDLKDKIPDLDLSNLKDVLPDMPELSNIVDKISTINDLSNLKDKIPDMPDLSELKDKIPDMPSLSEIVSKIPDIPDLSTLKDKLPDAPELSELKDKLPELPGLKEKLPDFEGTISELKEKIPEMKLPDIPDLGEFPDIQGKLSDIKEKLTGLPLPDLPSLPDLPDVSDLSKLPEILSKLYLPDLSNIDNLSNLVSLPDLSKLPMPELSALTKLSLDWTMPDEVRNLTKKFGAPDNDFKCKSTKHANPVIMLHGLSLSKDIFLNQLQHKLNGDGYCTYSLTYGARIIPDWIGGVRSISESAIEIADFIREVKEKTGAEKVDLVGHSEGGVQALYVPMTQPGIAEIVDHNIALGPAVHGAKYYGATDLFYSGGDKSRKLAGKALELLGCAACDDMATGGEVYEQFKKAERIVQPGNKATIIMSKSDTLVAPEVSMVKEEGVRNLVVQDLCPDDKVGHGGLATDETVWEMIINELQNTPDRKITCSSGVPV